MTNRLVLWSSAFGVSILTILALWSWLQTPELFQYMHHVFCL